MPQCPPRVGISPGPRKGRRVQASPQGGEGPVARGALPGWQRHADGGAHRLGGGGELDGVEGVALGRADCGQSLEDWRDAVQVAHLTAKRQAFM